MPERSPCFICRFKDEDKQLLPECMDCVDRLNYADSIDPNGAHIRRACEPVNGRRRELENHGGLFRAKSANCSKCGQLISVWSIIGLCDHCKDLRSVGRSEARCLDCGKRISVASQRCRRCSASTRDSYLKMTRELEQEVIRRRMEGETIAKICVETNLSYRQATKALKDLEALQAEGYIRAKGEAAQ